MRKRARLSIIPSSDELSTIRIHLSNAMNSVSDMNLDNEFPMMECEICRKQLLEAFQTIFNEKSSALAARKKITES